MTASEKAQTYARYAERLAYRFELMAAANPRTGSQRLRGPAVKNIKVRCPNNPTSMRAGYDRPTTDCASGHPCGWGITLTVEAEVEGRQRRRLFWGTTDWAASYGRRSAVESYNAELKGNRSVKLARAFTRVLGTTVNHVLLTFTLVGLNVRLLRDWHAVPLQRDPSMVDIDDFTDPGWHALHSHKTPRVREAALHVRLGLREPTPIRVYRHPRPRTEEHTQQPATDTMSGLPGVRVTQRRPHQHQVKPQ